MDNSHAPVQLPPAEDAMFMLGWLSAILDSGQLVSAGDWNNALAAAEEIGRRRRS